MHPVTVRMGRTLIELGPGGGRLSCYPEINHDFNNNHCFKFHDVLCTRAVSEIDSFLVYVYDLSGSYILMKMNLYRF